MLEEELEAPEDEKSIGKQVLAEGIVSANQEFIVFVPILVTQLINFAVV